jgi:peptidyl-prolyl cis-trans isomerase B (cyclophilin B)
MTPRAITLVLPLLPLLLAASAQAAEIFPVKGYARPEDAIVVKFVNEKGDEGKAAVNALGVDAGKLDNLFTPAPAAEIADAAGAPLFKIYNAAGEEQKLGTAKPGADGTVDLSDLLPKLKEGGVYFVTWKDAPPLVIETLYNPGRGAAELEKVKGRIDSLSPEEKKTALGQYSPVGAHMELAQIAVITTDKGVIKAKFDYVDAPHTVDNFISLARQNFYDGNTFHRIISGFMIQGGDGYANDKDLAGMGGPGYGIMHEFSNKKHVRGVLSMARNGAPSGGNDLMPGGSSYYDSAGSQFFIMHGTNSNLDGQYSAFGDVIEGMNVVDEIAKTPSEPGSGAVKGARPKIISVRIVPATAENYGLKK